MKKKRGVWLHLERALNSVPEKTSKAVVGEEFSSVVVEGQEVMRSTAADQRADENAHTIDIRRRQSDFDVRAVIRESHKAQAARRSEAQPAIIDATTNVVGDLEGAYDVSEGKLIAKNRSRMACGS